MSEQDRGFSREFLSLRGVHGADVVIPVPNDLNATGHCNILDRPSGSEEFGEAGVSVGVAVVPLRSSDFSGAAVAYHFQVSLFS